MLKFEQRTGTTLAPMKPRITLITLGVDDLERSLAFYRDGLGLATEGIVGTEFEHGAVVFFDLAAARQFPFLRTAIGFYTPSLIKLAAI